jgi:hypothetical protein
LLPDSTQRQQPASRESQSTQVLHTVTSNPSNQNFEISGTSLPMASPAQKTGDAVKDIGE